VSERRQQVLLPRGVFARLDPLSTRLSHADIRTSTGRRPVNASAPYLTPGRLRRSSRPWALRQFSSACPGDIPENWGSPWSGRLGSDPTTVAHKAVTSGSAT
jgi:hypothetical protein